MRAGSLLFACFGGMLIEELYDQTTSRDIVDIYIQKDSRT